MRLKAKCGVAIALLIMFFVYAWGPAASPLSLTVYISANPWSGPAPLTVNFDCIVSGGKEPYSYTWVFGDGGTAYEKSPIHTYNNPGMYLARVYVRDANNEEGSASTTIVVTNPAGELRINIDASPRSGNAPLTVTFTSFVTGGTQPYKYKWQFGDGGSGTNSVETHVYSAPGTYYAWCTVTDSSNPPKSQTSRSVRIDVFQGGQIVVQADAKPKEGPAPLVVDFAGSASGGTPPYKFTWDFGDGATAQGEKVTHTYVNPGVYQAYLVVQDASGSMGKSPPITINVFPPSPPLMVSASGSPTSGTAPLTVTFSGSVSGGIPPYTYLWDFGDGKTDNKLNTAHTYTTPGSYAAVLTATDSAQPPNTGKSNPIFITVNPAPGNIKVTSSATPTSGYAPLIVTFQGYASGGTPPYTYTWNFGDGTTAGINNITHTYTSGGVYYAVLSAKDSKGYSGSAPPITITVNIPPLTVYISASPVSGVVPLTVSFTSSVSGGTPPYAYMWEFGDGGTSAQPNPVYTYFTAGIYYAKLTVTDSGSPPQTATSLPVQITVNPAPSQIIVDVKISPTSGVVPLVVDFSASASGGTPPYTYTWIFGDGSTSSSNPVTHTYTSPGTYQAYARAKDSKGYEGTSVVTEIRVYPKPLSVSFTATPTSGNVPLTVSFTSTVTGGTQPYAYMWSFGDGGTSSIANPVYTYFTPGTYNVYLSVADSGNQNASAGPQVIVVNQTVTQLNVSATGAPTSGYAPLSVVFNGSVSGGVPPYSYKWSFGDGNTSGVLNVTHTYFTPGKYYAYVQAWDSSGQTGYSSQILVDVLAFPLDVHISAVPTSGQAPLTVSFISNVSGGLKPYFYHWDFGDGGSSSQPSPVHTYTSPGVYEAKLQVVDSFNQQATAGPIKITVEQASGTIKVMISATPTSGNAPLDVTFDKTIQGGKPPYKLEWVFGDGTTSSEERPTHTYTIPGVYQAYLKVWDADGVYGYSQPVSIEVFAVPLKVSISGTPLSGDVPLTVSFTSMVSGGIPPYTYMWAFGDGGTSNMPNPVYTYFTPGSFTVTLQVTDSGGVTALSSPIVIEVRPSNPTLKVMASGSPVSGYAPLTVTFQGYASGGVPPYSYKFVFGDGNESKTNNVTHIYTYAGTFTAYLLAYDANNNMGYSSPITITVLGGGQLIVNAYGTPVAGPAPLTVNFTATAGGGYPPYTFYWTFGDGNTGIGENVKHVYLMPGTYAAFVTVYDSSNHSATSPIIQIQVKVKGDFTVKVSAQPTSGYAPLTVQFSGEVSGGYEPYTYLWSFGDGGTSQEKDPVYTYTKPGVYDAILTVEDATGRMNISSVVITVLEGVQISYITIDPPSSTLSVGDTILFSAKAFDTKGTDISDKTNFTWVVIGAIGSLTSEQGRSVTFVASNPGSGLLRVRGEYGGGNKFADASITVLSGTPPPGVIPKVVITHPREGDTVKNFVEITGYAIDGILKVKQVVIQIDDRPGVNATLEPSSGNRTNWSYIWDTSVETSGIHRITVYAFDGSFKSQNATLNVTVTKESTPPPPETPAGDEWLLWLVLILLLIAVASAGAILYLLNKRKTPKPMPPEEVSETPEKPPEPQKIPEKPREMPSPPPSPPPPPAPSAPATVSSAERLARRREAIRRARERMLSQKSVSPPPAPAGRVDTPPPVPQRPQTPPQDTSRTLTPRERLQRIRERRMNSNL